MFKSGCWLVLPTWWSHYYFQDNLFPPSPPIAFGVLGIIDQDPSISKSSPLSNPL